MTITESTNLDQTEIERMVREAEQHAAEDRRRREEIDARNELDSLAYRAEQLVSELQDRLPVHEKARAEQLVADARQAIEEQAGLDRVRPLIADLQQLVHALPARARRRRPPAGGNGGGNGAGARARATTRRSSMPSSPATETGDRRTRRAAEEPERREPRRPSCERARAARGPLQAGACRPRQLPQALGARGRAPGRGGARRRCCATGSRPSTASSARCG